jgi:Xaa-Pro aminopeptidase
VGVFEERIVNFKKLLKTKNLDGFIVTNPINIFYLTGFIGFSQTEREAMLVFSKKVTLITARLYQNEAQKVQSKNLSIFIANERNEIKSQIQILLKNAKRVGFEENDLKFSEHKNINKNLKSSKLVGTKSLISDLRLIKSTEEVAKIEKAQIISQTAFHALIKTLKVGQREQEISQKLSQLLNHFGAQGQAFESIVATGANSGLPHYKTGQRKLKKNDILLLDFGAKYQNYCADLTRTVFVGRANAVQRNIYDLVFKSQQEAIKHLRTATDAKKAFLIANNVFTKANYQDSFLHSLGHGIGLEVHEPPSLSKKSSDLLKPGMVFSVEPGLYFNWGGIRIEDLVAIKTNGPKFLGKISTFVEVAI